MVLSEYLPPISRYAFPEVCILANGQKRIITGSRATLPKNLEAEGGSELEVLLPNGRKIPADLIIRATGQTPNSQFIDDPSHLTENGYIKVRPTLQFQAAEYSHVFAAGDIADTGAQKAAKFGITQAGVVSRNIAALVAGQEPTAHVEIFSHRIHVTMGLVSSFSFFYRDIDMGTGN